MGAFAVLGSASLHTRILKILVDRVLLPSAGSMGVLASKAWAGAESMFHMMVRTQRIEASMCRAAGISGRLGHVHHGLGLIRRSVLRAMRIGAWFTVGVMLHRRWRLLVFPAMSDFVPLVKEESQHNQNDNSCGNTCSDGGRIDWRWWRRRWRHRRRSRRRTH